MGNLDTIYQAGTTGMGVVLFLILIVWTIAWKGWSLWVASKESKKNWFIALLILNTAGILPILYLFVFSDRAKKKRKETPRKEVILEVEVDK